MADVDVDLFEALHASPILRQRAGKIATRVANNPRTPNRRQLEQEQDALNALARKLEALSDAHFARIKETLQREDHARPSHECGRGCPGWDAGVLDCPPQICGKFDGVCVRPPGHDGGCSNPAQPEDAR